MSDDDSFSQIEENELKFSHIGLCISAISAISLILREIFLTVYVQYSACHILHGDGSEFFSSSDREISAPSPGPEEEIL